MAEEQKRAGQQEHYPEAMLDMGMPEEMSTAPQLAGENNASSPMVEIRQPLEVGGVMEEIRRPEDLTQDR